MRTFRLATLATLLASLFATLLPTAASAAVTTTWTTATWQTKANRPVSASNPDIDCADIPARYRPVRITGTDYHRLDRDHDGWGCD